jgi:hypothetical protein
VNHGIIEDQLKAYLSAKKRARYEAKHSGGKE